MIMPPITSRRSAFSSSSASVSRYNLHANNAKNGQEPAVSIAVEARSVLPFSPFNFQGALPQFTQTVDYFDFAAFVIPARPPLIDYFLSRYELSTSVSSAKTIPCLAMSFDNFGSALEGILMFSKHQERL